MYRGQAGALLASAIPPWVANAVFLIGVSPFSGLDPTPFAFTITGTAMAWGMLRFRLMEIVPVARDAIIEGMSDGIVVLDNQNRILDVNPSAIKVLGNGVQDVIGKPASIVFSDNPDLLVACEDSGNSVLEISRAYGGAQLWFDVHTSGLHDRRGRHIGKVMTLRDITDRRLAEEALRQVELEKQESERKHMAEQLQQAQKMEGVGRLTSGVAHDFNNLITGILGYTQLCMLGLSPENAKVHRDLEEIQKTATRASALTHQLLAFARRQSSEPQVFCLNDVILEMDRMLRRLIGEDVSLFTHTSSEPGNIEADPGKIEQVLVNLVVNARDAMQTGGEIRIETANVTIRPKDQPQEVPIPNGRYVLMTVSDTGIGMTEAVKAKVFDAFFTTKEKGKGTGLGLSTCKEIVQECNGYIALDSQLGKGTTFRIYLPLVESDATPDERSSQSKEISPGTGMILLVEDEPLVREVTGQMLEDQGYHVLQAAGGTDALELALTHSQAHIDLLLTDIVMPTMDGKELAAHFRMVHPEARVLFTSGYTDEILESHGVDHTKVSFMQKPFSADRLAQCVRDALEAPLGDASVSELVESPR
jgi:PAS domain S-box-containing protein